MHVCSQRAVPCVLLQHPKLASLLAEFTRRALQAMIPCTEAQAEAKPVSIPFQFTMDAPIEVVWAKIDDWSHDHSWVQGSQVSTSKRSRL